MILKQLYRRTESGGNVYVAVGNGSEELEVMAKDRIGGSAFHHLIDNVIISKAIGRRKHFFYFLEESDFHRFNALGAIEEMNENEGKKWEIVEIDRATHYWSGASFVAMPKAGVYVTPARIFARAEVSEKSRLEEQHLALVDIHKKLKKQSRRINKHLKELERINNEV